MTSDRIILEYEPRSGPRRRVTFERDGRLAETEEITHAYWRIEEVRSADGTTWREVGREHVSEPDLVFERGTRGTDPDPITADTGVSRDV